MLQIAEMSYTPQYPDNPTTSSWQPDGEDEENKLKLLQTLLAVPVTGDLDTATVSAIKKTLFKYALASRKGLTEQIDTIIQELQALAASKSKTDEPAKPVAAWYLRYKWYLAAGGIVTVAGLIIAKKKGMF